MSNPWNPYIPDKLISMSLPFLLLENKENTTNLFHKTRPIKTIDPGTPKNEAVV